MGRKAATPQPDRPTPGEVLRAVISTSKEPDISVAELARRANMTRPNVSRLLSGETPFPSVQTIEAILAAIGSNLCHYQRSKNRIEKSTD